MHTSCHTTETTQFDNTITLTNHLSGKVLILNFSSSPPIILHPFCTANTLQCSKLGAQPCTTLHTSKPHLKTIQFDSTPTLTTHLSGKVQVLNFSSSPPNHPPSHFCIKTLHRINWSLRNIFSSLRIHFYWCIPCHLSTTSSCVVAPLSGARLWDGVCCSVSAGSLNPWCLWFVVCWICNIFVNLSIYFVVSSIPFSLRSSGSDHSLLSN